MFLDMIVFMWLAIRYKSIPLDLLQDIDEGGEGKPSPLDFKESDKKDDQ